MAARSTGSCGRGIRQPSKAHWSVFAPHIRPPPHCRRPTNEAEQNVEECTMRFMVMVKATKNSEAGAMPGTQLLAGMGKFNEELVKAGVMLAGEGLQPSAKGKRVQFGAGKRSVVDGPFAETKELVAGFWLWRCKSIDEAVEWVKRCPDPMPGEASEIEIRQVFEAEDFGTEYTA